MCNLTASLPCCLFFLPWLQSRISHQLESFKCSHSTVGNDDGVYSVNVLSDDNERPALLILQHRRYCNCQLLLVLIRSEEFAARVKLTLRHIKLCRDKNQKSLAFGSWMRGNFLRTHRHFDGGLPCGRKSGSIKKRRKSQAPTSAERKERKSKEAAVAEQGEVESGR